MEIAFVIILFILLFLIVTHRSERKFTFKLTKYHDAKLVASVCGFLDEFNAIYNTYRYIDELDESTAIEYTMQDLKL